jgi:hypothetical protein
MKKRLIFSAMSVVLLALGLALTGCPTESSDDYVLPANLQNTTWEDGNDTLEFRGNEIVLDRSSGVRTFKVVSATENGSIVAGETYFGDYYEEEEFCSSYSISADGTTLTLYGGRSFSGIWTRPSGGDGGGGGDELDGAWEGSKGAYIIFDGNTFEYFGPHDYSGTFATSGSTITFYESSLGAASGNFTVSGGTLTLYNHGWDSFVNDTYTQDD